MMNVSLTFKITTPCKPTHRRHRPWATMQSRWSLPWHGIWYGHWQPQAAAAAEAKLLHHYPLHTASKDDMAASKAPG